MPKDQSKQKPVKSRAAKAAGIASTVMWVLSIVLSFVIPAKTAFIWIPDFLLLAGFWPLLWVWRPGWPWIIFGVLNTAMGFLLEIAYVLPEATFAPVIKTWPTFAVVRAQLQEHSFLTWIIIGVISTVFGVIRTVKHIVEWIVRRAKKQ